MESLETATLCGISPLEFWELTPFELALMFKAYTRKKEEDTKEKITMAYMSALWTAQWFGKKQNHPKPLKEILKGTELKKPMTDEEMLERVKVLNAILGGEVK